MNRIAPMIVALVTLGATPPVSHAQTTVIQPVPHRHLMRRPVLVAPRPPAVVSPQPGFDATPESPEARAGLSRNSANCKFGCVGNHP